MPLPSYFKQLVARFQVFKDFRRNLKKKKIFKIQLHQQKISSTLLVNLFLLWIVWLFACFLFGVLWGGRGSCGVIISGFFWHASSFRIN
jgi:hypothetical protein